MHAGLGNYEGLHLGVEHSIFKWNTGYGLGTDFNVTGQGWFNEIHGYIGRQLWREKENQKVKKFIDLKCLVWNLENQSNIFSAVSLGPQLRFSKTLHKNLKINAFGGLIWTSVFRYERKGYLEVGFPREWQPGFGFSISKTWPKK